MNKTGGVIVIAIIVIAIGVGLLLYLNSTANNTTSVSNTSSSSNTISSSDTSSQGSLQNSILILNSAFSPNVTTIQVGTTVLWTNQDGVTHSVVDDNGAFTSGDILDSAQFSYTFNTPGTYTYHCAIHPDMTGKIVVTQ